MQSRHRSLLVACLFFLLAVTAMASPPDPESARAELVKFSEQLRDIPGIDPKVADEARTGLASAPPEAVVAVHAAFEKVEGWRELPSVAAGMSTAVEKLKAEQLRRIIAESTTNPAAALDRADTESRREVLLSVVTFLRALAPLGGPETDQQGLELQNLILTASPDHLPMIAKALAAALEDLKLRLAAPAVLEPGMPAKRLPIAVNAVDCSSYCCTRVCDPTGIFGCGDVCIPGCTAACDAIVSAASSLISGVISGLEATKAALESTVNSIQSSINYYVGEITRLANEVQGYINTIAQFVTDAFNAASNLVSQVASLITNLDQTFEDLWGRVSSVMSGFINDLIALVPASPEAAFNLLTGINLNDTSWVNTLLSRFPVLEAPCPAFGTSVGPLGTVGTLGAAQKSDGIAKLTKIFYDAAPSDTAGIKVKLIAASIYHPAEYWNLCARSRYAIHEFEEETAHRQNQTTNLNVALSTRGTQTSVDALGLSVGNVDNQVAGAEGKLDALTAKDDELLRRLDQPLSTRVMQTSIDALGRTIGTMDADVVKVESKLDMLQANVRKKAQNQSERQASLAAFEQLMTRLAIEDNLLGGSNNVVSQYQLPEAYGGRLTLVRSVVQNTIDAMLAAGQSTYSAQTEFARGDALLTVGDFAAAFKQFRKAYGDAVKP